MRELEPKGKDKIENVKQQKQETQRVLQNRLRPYNGHSLFEVDLEALTIVPAEYDKNLVIHWNDALKGLISTTKEITKKENKLYISALNKRNVKKILKRDHNIIL